MNKGTGVIVGVLAVALLIVLVFWMRDRESQDLKIDLDIGAAVRTTDAAILAGPGETPHPSHFGVGLGVPEPMATASVPSASEKVSSSAKPSCLRSSGTMSCREFS